MTKHTDTMFGVWPLHDKTDWYYIWGLTISWQSRLILCLGLDHFITKQTNTMSGAWLFHVKTNWYYLWVLIISWQHTLIICLELDHFIIYVWLVWNNADVEIKFIIQFHLFIIYWTIVDYHICAFIICKTKQRIWKGFI
jgi:hypothetical protein